MKLPNVRKLFVPDSGRIIADADLDRADLQVVVWEADDADLKRQLRMGVDLHIMNGILLEGHEPPPEDELVDGHPNYPEHKRRYRNARVFAKAFVHGSNYGGGAPTMARNCGITVKHCEFMQRRWFEIHPGIKDWHERTLDSLYRTRSVTNKFGFRRMYFDRIEGILPEALAWVPQSTIAVVTNKGLYNLDTNLPEVHVHLQVHDSIVFSYPKASDPSIRPRIRDQLTITIPYDDPLIIPVGLKTSEISWGDCKETHWE